MDKSDEKISTDELDRQFPDGVPPVAMKILFPEASHPLTIAEIRTILAALAATTSEPVAVKASAWMRRWAFDGVDVMAIKKADRPEGWQLVEVTKTKLLSDDVALYPTPPAARGGLRDG